MSIEKNYYVIAGYDLTGYQTDNYEDWKWTDDGEYYHCGPEGETIQLFDDPMSGGHLYLGHILARGDEYCFETTKLSVGDILDMAIRMRVKEKLHNLIEAGVINAAADSADYQVIIFEECY